jgi:MFS family permease
MDRHFRGTNLKRTLTSVFIAVSTGITGSKFIAIYSTIFLAGVGIGNPYLISLIVAMCAWQGAFPGPFIIEYAGRRLSLLLGYGGMAICILIVAAVGTGPRPNSAVAKTLLIVFLCLWAATYGAFVGTSIAITAPEMHAVRLRTYGQACTTDRL